MARPRLGVHLERLRHRFRGGCRQRPHHDHRVVRRLQWRIPRGRPDHGRERQLVRHNQGGRGARWCWHGFRATNRFPAVLPLPVVCLIRLSRRQVTRRSPSPPRTSTAAPTPVIPARSTSRAATPRPSCPPTSPSPLPATASTPSRSPSRRRGRSRSRPPIPPPPRLPAARRASR